MRKHIPNFLSVLRMVLSLALLMVGSKTVFFWALYLFAGVTDMLDGFLARRWKVESKVGARLDGIADFVFVMVVGCKLLPSLLSIPVVLWIMVGVVALVKIINAISGFVVKRQVVFLHTKANKLTGFLLFIGIMAIDHPFFIPLAWGIAIVALFAAVQEGHFIRKRR